MLAIIPAREGSKGLPGKNIKLLGGKPLLAYSVEAALNAKGITRVILSTDSEEIARIGIQYGVECPFLRPSELATDDAKSIDVYKYTLKKLEELEGNNIAEVVVLQPTSPLRTAQDIDNAIDIYKSKCADSVISYCLESHPIKWHKYITAEGKFENIFSDTIKNRQDEKPSFFPNGSIYIFARHLLEKEIYYTPNSFAYIMDRKASVDIDTLDDFEYAEYLLQQQGRM